MTFRHPLAAFVTAVVSLALVALPAAASPPISAPPGGIGLRLTEAPVSAADDPRAHIYIVDHLAPGSVIERRMEVSNTTNSSQHVELYAAAATIDDGTFVGATGDTQNELSSWTSVSPDGSDVPSGGVVEAAVTIAVPSDAAPGEQYGVVWAQVRSQAAGGGVAQVSRVGIRLYVSVGPGGPPAADFTVDLLTAGRAADGRPTVSANVHNTGGRALDLTGAMQLTDGPGGLTTREFAADLGSTLAPGDTRPISITMDGSLPAGPWTATVNLASGLTTRTVQAVITFPDAGLAAPTAIMQPERHDTPWVLAVAVGLAAALFAVASFMVIRRWHRAPNQRRQPLTPSVAP